MMEEKSGQAVNFDEYILESQRVDTNFEEPTLSQVLRIALYDEYHAFETYNKIISVFGEVNPFVNIRVAEQRHIEAVYSLCMKYGIEPPINNWYDKIEIANSLVECCEMGVVGEIENIKMYDHLLGYVEQYPDIQDVFYKLQAASYNNHLPAFRSCVQQYYQQQSLGQNQMDGLEGVNDEQTMQKVDEFRSLAQKVANGKMTEQDIMKLASGVDMATIGGLILGGLGVMQLVKSMENNKGE